MKNFLLLFAFIPSILMFARPGQVPAGYPVYVLLMIWVALEYFPGMAQRASHKSLLNIHQQYVNEIQQIEGDSVRDVARKLAKVQHSSDLFFESR